MAKLRENDNWGVGQAADGKILAYSPEEARKLIEQRNAEESSDDSIFDISNLEKLDSVMKPTKGKTKDRAMDAASVHTALRLAIGKDRLGFFKGLRRVNVIPDRDKWNADYNDQTDQITLRRKFLGRSLKEQVNILLHEAGHRGQFKNPALFKAFKAAGLGKVKEFHAMANHVHRRDYAKNGINNPVEEAFAESYSRWCLGLPMPADVRKFWEKKGK